MPGEKDGSVTDISISAALPAEHEAADDTTEPATTEVAAEATGIDLQDTDLQDTEGHGIDDHDTDMLDTGSHETDEIESGTSTVLAAAVPLLLIAGLLAFAIVLLFTRSDGEAQLDVVDPSERSVVSPLEPEGDAPVTGPGIIETFTDGDSSGLGETDNGRNWGEVFGQWDIVDGRAQLLRDPDGRALVVAETGVVNGVLTVTMPVSRAQAGVVFRLVDFNNYWMLVAVPNVGTWNLRKIVDGQMTEVTNLGLATSADGVTITISYDGEQIALGINGEQKAEVTDDTHLGATAVGLTSAGPTSTEASWDNLMVTPRLTPGRGQ